MMRSLCAAAAVLFATGSTVSAAPNWQYKCLYSVEVKYAKGTISFWKPVFVSTDPYAVILEYYKLSHHLSQGNLHQHVPFHPLFAPVDLRLRQDCDYVPIDVPDSAEEPIDPPSRATERDL